MSKINELEAELMDLNFRISLETDDNLIAYLLAEKTKVEAKIADARKVEEKVEAEAVPFAVAGVSLDGIPVEVVQLIEEIVKTDRRRIYNEHAVELEQIENELALAHKDVEQKQERLQSLSEQFSTYQDGAMKNIQQLTADTCELTARAEDAESKRDAAVREKEELATTAHEQFAGLTKQIELLQAELQRYREAEEYQSRQEAIVTPDATEAVSLQAKLEAVKKLYTHTEDWGSIIKAYKPDGSYERIKRTELESDWAPADVPEVATITPPELTFQGNEENNTYDRAVPQHTIDGTLDAEAVGSDETFEQEVRRRLKHLEDCVYGKPHQGVA